MRNKSKLIILFFGLLPFSAQSFLPPNSLFGKVVNKINTDKKVVAISFDDGPNQIYTYEVLKILQEKKVRATFFLNGRNIRGNEILLRMMQVEGHSVSNHGFSHQRFDLMWPNNISEEIEKTQNEIERVNGQNNHLFRAPYGLYNNPFLMNYLSKNGFSVIGWSVDPKDWQEKDPGKIVAEVLKETKPGNIILLHDGPEDFGKKGVVNREATVKALPLIIDDLKNQGYSFLTIPELLTLEEKVLGKKTRRWFLWNF